ncbi:MAG TPA: dihydrolipoamide acetyltransferase family protein [Ktedonobacteraceae bacterium]|nr:dihydrolipoamide acetyltransferase family protein [Ktedonobacteraceae bacterium]
MERSLTMPRLGATMTEGTVLRWLYQPGERITKGEPLLEVMTDKVNIEVEAPINGRLVKILAQDGEVLPIGAPLALLADDAETQTVAGNKQPHLSERIASTPAAKREAALRNIDLPAVVQAGATPPLTRDDILAFSQQQTSMQKESGRASGVQATPLAQKIAREHQVDLSALAGRKAGEKVTRADIEAYLQETARRGQEAVAVPVVSPVAPLLPTTETGDETLIPLTPARQLIAQRMRQSISTAPHMYLDLEIDMTEAERCRQSIGRHMEARGEPAPSLTALIVRATAAAIVLHPEVNSVFEQGVLQGKDAIRQRKAVHIGIATDTERALLTPVIRDAHLLSLPAIAGELRRLTHAARQGTLKPEELTGATFTISNLGMYGIDTFHAIIVPGQSAILAVGKVTRRGVVVGEDENERLEIRPIMRLSLSADHRVLDGASGSRFLQQLKVFLENPYLLL